MFACIQEPLSYYRIHNTNFSLINDKLELKEFESWISKPEIISNSGLNPYLKYINQRIIFLRTIKNIDEGNLKKAIKDTLFFPLSLNKIKLILHIILPKNFLRKIKNFH